MSTRYTDAELAQLASVLGCDPGDVEQNLAGYRAAAEEEYVRMILGQHVYSRGQDIKVYRLSLLIRHAFGGRLPSEGQISALFQTTTTESRSLLRAVRAKFQYELREAVRQTMRASLASATQDRDGSGAWTMVCASQNVIDAFNEEIARRDGTLPPVTRASGTAAEYDIAASTYAALSAILQ